MRANRLVISTLDVVANEAKLGSSGLSRYKDIMPMGGDRAIRVPVAGFKEAKWMNQRNLLFVATSSIQRGTRSRYQPQAIRFERKKNVRSVGGMTQAFSTTHHILQGLDVRHRWWDRERSVIEVGDHAIR